MKMPLVDYCAKSDGVLLYDIGRIQRFVWRAAWQARYKLEKSEDHQHNPLNNHTRVAHGDPCACLGV